MKNETSHIIVYIEISGILEISGNWHPWGHIKRAAIVLILASNTMLLIDVTQQTQPFSM